MDIATPSMISKYQVIRVLGRGGMGEVLLAQDDLGRRVAIKRPFASAAADGLARFKVEARAATLTHVNIPVVYEMGAQEDGLPFIAMEYVEGEPLDKLIASGKELDLITKLSIVEQVCAGLGYAHEKGIIHRDIKPANIIVQPNGVAKIIDFGIAKITNVEQTSDLTQASQIIGSLHYIAPERFKAEAVDGRVDIFSAGVILFLLLTGTLPFAGGEATASYRIVNEAHSSLAAHLGDYPKALDEILDRALAKNPDDRFDTAEDFADALKDVIDDLKRSKVSVLFSDAERLTMESRYEPALELLDDALKLEPANTQVRKLRRMVRDHQERGRKAERLRDYISRADSLLAAGSYAEALLQLKEAQRVDPASTELRDRAAFVEEKKTRHERGSAALVAAEAARNRGDITAALQIAERAIQEDPDNTALLAVRGAIAKQVERETMQKQVAALLDSAQAEFSRQNFPAMEKLLTEAAAIDSSHPKIEELRSELARVRELEERRQLIEEIQRRVNDFLRGDNYEQASELLKRAIEKLPSEATLHRLKMDVDTAARKFDSNRFIESAISTARQTFATDPEKALAGLHSAMDQMPGEERLIACERSLRQQADTLRKQQSLSEALRNARELIAARQPDKAIGVLEAYHVEHGAHADVDELLVFAREEAAEQQRRSLIERTTQEVRILVREERLDEAVRMLESAIESPSVKQSSDRTLAGLLEDVRQQQAASLHKLDVVRKRALMLRDRGELDEAIRVLEEYLASGARNVPAQELLASLQAEAERKQITAQAIEAADLAAKQGHFAASFESLQSVVRAYGESDELTRATEQVKAVRSAYAQEVVSQSIAASRAALLKNDVPGAMAALRGANEMVEFAEPARQADWRRIGQAAKRAEAEPPAAGAVIADPLADLGEAPPLRKAMSPVMLISGIVALCAVLAVVGLLVFRHSPPPPASIANEAHLSLTKVPAGAVVSITDLGKHQTADASGSVTFTVPPGKHTFDVTMAGFDHYDENFQVQPGDNYREPISMTKQVLASMAGTLMMQSSVSGFKVFIDGHPRGEIMQKGGTLTLEEGKHSVRYTNEDGTDFVPEHAIDIIAGKTTPDTFTLKAPAPVVAKTPAPTAPAPTSAPTGTLVIETTPNAQVAVDHQPKGTADGNGRLTVGSLAAAEHVVEISLDKYQSAAPHSVPVSAGGTAHLVLPLTALPPPPPSSGSLSIQTNPGAQVSFNNGQHKGTADGSGQFNVEGVAPGTYPVEITLEHFQPTKITAVIRAGSNVMMSSNLQPVPVAAPPEPKPVDNKPAVAENSADIQGIKDALANFEQAYRSKNLTRIQANWLNIGATRSKGLAGALQIADVVNINENCESQPVINGNSASQTCVETTQFMKSDPPRRGTKTITYSKVNGKWILKDKVP